MSAVLPPRWSDPAAPAAAAPAHAADASGDGASGTAAGATGAEAAVAALEAAVAAAGGGDEGTAAPASAAEDSYSVGDGRIVGRCLPPSACHGTVALLATGLPSDRCPGSAHPAAVPICLYA